MKYVLAFIVGLLLGEYLRADEFTDRLNAFEARTKANNCGTKGCKCSPCTTSAKKPPKAPLYYKHVCGCAYAGGSGCNCAPLGGCHCAENTRFNRINPVWIKAQTGPGYCLWRGGEQLGYLDEKGVYHPLFNDEWCEPTKAPIPLPMLQSMVIPVRVQACRT
jgi:hypothetical protein